MTPPCHWARLQRSWRATRVPTSLTCAGESWACLAWNYEAECCIASLACLSPEVLHFLPRLLPLLLPVISLLTCASLTQPLLTTATATAISITNSTNIATTSANTTAYYYHSYYFYHCQSCNFYFVLVLLQLLLLLLIPPPLLTTVTTGTTISITTFATTPVTSVLGNESFLSSKIIIISSAVEHLKF